MNEEGAMIRVLDRIADAVERYLKLSEEADERVTLLMEEQRRALEEAGKQQAWHRKVLGQQRQQVVNCPMCGADYDNLCEKSQ